MRQKIEKNSDVPAGLWFASTKVRGLSEVFNMAAAEPPFGETGLSGIGYILAAVADELDNIRDIVEYGDRPDLRAEDSKEERCDEDSSMIARR